MVIGEEARQLLVGAYDMHIHGGPDIMPRKGNDLDFARRAAAAGMAGIMIKSHYTSTADRVALVNEVVAGTRCYGALSLNHAVGGLNAIAVDVAGRSGGRLVWFPTVDAENEVAHQQRHPDGKKAYWYTMQQLLQQQGIYRPPFSILGEDGRLLPETYQVLEAIKAHDMILATGHVSVAETRMLVGAAREMGVQRILVTHPEFPSVGMPVEIQVELVGQGAYLERCWTQPYLGMVSWERVFDAIRQTGPARNVVSSDLGQPGRPWPDEGLADFLQRLLEAGFTPDEVGTMVSANPGALVGQ